MLEVGIENNVSWSENEFRLGELGSIPRSPIEKIRGVSSRAWRFYTTIFLKKCVDPVEVNISNVFKFRCHFAIIGKVVVLVWITYFVVVLCFTQVCNCEE